ncbi:MAG: DUF5723 family protein [Bacteroidota bacterium]
MTRQLIFLFILILFGSLDLSAQMYLDNGRQICCGDSIISGKYRALGVNPAHLGRTARLQRSGGILQIGGSLYGQGLDLGELLDATFTENVLSDTLKEGILSRTNPQENFEYEGRLNINWISFSIASEKLGGIAVGIQDRWLNTGVLPNDAINLLALGQNSQVFQNASGASELGAVADGSRLSYSHVRELRIGYGRRMMKVGTFSLYGGFTYKRLWGIGYLGAQIENGLYEGVSSFAELYDINFGQLNLRDPGARNQLLSSAGGGSAFDIGIVMDIGEKLTLAASIVDVGNLTWKKDILESEIAFEEVIGDLGDGIINSYNLSEEVGNLFDLVQSEAGNEFEVPLNTRLRLNSSIRLSQKLILHAELLTPFDKDNVTYIDQDAAIFHATATLSPVKLFRINSGVYYSGRYGWRMPLGVSFGFRGKSMLSIATTDILTFFTNRSPLASLSISTIGLGG